MSSLILNTHKYKNNPFCFISTEVKEAFGLFDLKNQGKIPTSRLGEAVRSLGLNPSEEEVQQMIREVDIRGKWNHT